jgi:hypothetical protein
MSIVALFYGCLGRDPCVSVVSLQYIFRMEHSNTIYYTDKMGNTLIPVCGASKIILNAIT